jgi:hypothetical protein
MTKQKVGLVIFWIAVIWAILWGVVIGFTSVGPAFRNLTLEEVSQTIWATTGPLFLLWGIGAPLGAIVAGIGILLYSGAKGSTVWKFGIGTFLGFVIAMAITNMQLGHFPPLFGIGGTLILLSFIGILWLWAKERMALKGSSTTAADFKLVGYVFMLIAAWFVCGLAGQQFAKAFEGEVLTSPVHVIVFLVLGWLFLFLSHYKSRKQQG